MSFLIFFFSPFLKEKPNAVEKETVWGRQQNYASTVQIMQGLRLWFLPGIAEELIELKPEPGDLRFGMDIKRTEEVTYFH